MTVIAWDGKTLAGDKRTTNNQVVRKIFLVRGCLVGYAGNFGTCTEMLAWFKAGAKPSKFPEAQRNVDESVDLLVILPDRTITTYGISPYPFVIEQSYYAVGSGADFATCAMYLGKSAVEAVMITAENTQCCGSGVDHLQLPRRRL